MEFYRTSEGLLEEKSNVSIPNGMEFYTGIALFLKPILIGFNSQRDGILPCSLASSKLSSSFNSQRDGILHVLCRYMDLSPVFQFPTGWNSTGVKIDLPLSPQKFQFPTGWNSTLPCVREVCF